MVATSPDDHSAESLGILSPVHGRETDPIEDDDAADHQLPPSAFRPTAPARGYKPGTRQKEPKPATVTGTPPWWSAPRGDQAWTENTERLRAHSLGDTKNLIGWKSTGLTGGAGH